MGLYSSKRLYFLSMSSRLPPRAHSVRLVSSRLDLRAAKWGAGGGGGGCGQQAVLQAAPRQRTLGWQQLPAGLRAGSRELCSGCRGGLHPAHLKAERLATAAAP